MDLHLIERTRAFVFDRFKAEGSGHDYYHIERVWKNAITIGTAEKANLYVVELAALLHDIADFKAHGGDTTIGPRKAREYLQRHNVELSIIDHVAEIIETLSFKGKGQENPMRALEGRVVRDADRLDAIGAIGIARCFTYGGSKGTPIYLPEVPPQEFANTKDYVTNQTHQINHFHEKLLLLKDLMLTETGKKMALHRHEFMQAYLKEFHAEWNGER